MQTQMHKNVMQNLCKHEGFLFFRKASYSLPALPADEALR